MSVNLKIVTFLYAFLYLWDRLILITKFCPPFHHLSTFKLYVKKCCKIPPEETYISYLLYKSAKLHFNGVLNLDNRASEGF